MSELKPTQLTENVYYLLMSWGPWLMITYDGPDLIPLGFYDTRTQEFNKNCHHAVAVKEICKLNFNFDTSVAYNEIRQFLMTKIKLDKFTENTFIFSRFHFIVYKMENYYIPLGTYNSRTYTFQQHVHSSFFETYEYNFIPEQDYDNFMKNNQAIIDDLYQEIENFVSLEKEQKTYKLPPPEEANLHPIKLAIYNGSQDTVDCFYLPKGSIPKADYEVMKAFNNEIYRYDHNGEMLKYFIYLGYEEEYFSRYNFFGEKFGYWDNIHVESFTEATGYYESFTYILWSQRCG